MNTHYRTVSDIQPYRSAPELTEEEIEAIATMIQQFGFRRPVVVDKDGVIVMGYARWLAAKTLGMQEIPVHYATDLTPEQVQALRQADRQVDELAEWCRELLPLEQATLKAAAAELASANQKLQELVQSLSDERPTSKRISEKYTPLIQGLLYQPWMSKPPALNELYDDRQLRLLLAQIQALHLPPELDYFFRLAAHRFVRFRFDLIAEYYAHANEQTRQLMRDLLLVIVDMDDAITQGVLRLSQKLITLIQEAETSSQRQEVNI